jgi:hypothetical protein
MLLLAWQGITVEDIERVNMFVMEWHMMFSGIVGPVEDAFAP